MKVIKEGVDGRNSELCVLLSTSVCICEANKKDNVFLGEVDDKYALLFIFRVF